MSRMPVAGCASALLAFLGTGCGGAPPETIPARTAGSAVAPAEYWRSLSPPELRHRPEPIPDSENAYVLWSALAGARLEPDDAGLVDDVALTAAGFPGGEAGERLRGFLESKRAHLEIFEAGLARGRCRFASIDEFLSIVDTLQQAALLKRVLAKRDAADGDFASAWRQADSILRLGDVLLRAGTNVTGYLLATGFESMALDTFRWLAARRDIPAEILAGAGFEEPADPDRVFAGAWRGEHDHLLSEITAVPDSSDPERLAGALIAEPGAKRQVAALLEGHPRAFDKAATVRLLGRTVLEVLRNAERPWPDRDPTLGRDILEATDAWPEPLRPASFIVGSAGEDLSPSELASARDTLRGVDNPVGKLLIRPVFDFPFFGDGLARYSHARKVHQRAERSATKTVLKLLLYERRAGALPEDLGTLVRAGLLDGIPADPFGTGTLLYAPERRILWSRGPDGEDDAGSDGEGDVVWNVPPLGN